MQINTNWCAVEITKCHPECHSTTSNRARATTNDGVGCATLFKQALSYRFRNGCATPNERTVHVSYEEISASRDTRPRQVSHKRLSRLMRAHIACKIHSLLSTMTTTNRGSLGMKGSVSFQRVQLSGTLWAIFCMHFFYSLVSVHSPSVSVFLLVVSLSPSSIWMQPKKVEQHEMMALKNTIDFSILDAVARSLSGAACLRTLWQWRRNIFTV